jgi:2,3-dihydro-2,3-dihydroxybenzoate dehydrogenase
MAGNGINGTVAVVTGAGNGIGAAVAAALAEEGALVAAVDLREDDVRDVVDRVREKGHVASAYAADVSGRSAVERMVDRVEQDLGPIGILVNVAGVLRFGPVVALSDEDWAATFAVNTTGVFLASRAVARRMVPRRSGAIVTVGSNAAGVPRMNMAAYAASKAAATLFTKSLGLELARYGIRCNVVSPGPTDTAMQRSLWPEDREADGTGLDRQPLGARAVITGSLESFKVGIPLGRLADPSDIADAVLFLLSDRAAHITMHDLYVDGGTTLRA